MLSLSFTLLIFAALCICVQGKPFCFQYESPGVYKNCVKHEKYTVTSPTIESNNGKSHEKRDGEDGSADSPTHSSKDKYVDVGEDIGPHLTVPDSLYQKAVTVPYVTVPGGLEDEDDESTNSPTPSSKDTQSRRRRIAKAYAQETYTGTIPTVESDYAESHETEDEEDGSTDSPTPSSEETQSRRRRIAKAYAQETYTGTIPTVESDYAESHETEDEEDGSTDSPTPSSEETQSRRRRIAKAYAQETYTGTIPTIESDYAESHETEDEEDGSTDSPTPSSEETQSRRRRIAKAYAQETYTGTIPTVESDYAESHETEDEEDGNTHSPTTSSEVLAPLSRRRRTAKESAQETYTGTIPTIESDYAESHETEDEEDGSTDSPTPSSEVLAPLSRRRRTAKESAQETYTGTIPTIESDYAESHETEDEEDGNTHSPTPSSEETQSRRRRIAKAYAQETYTGTIPTIESDYAESHETEDEEDGSTDTPTPSSEVLAPLSRRRRTAKESAQGREEITTN